MSRLYRILLVFAVLFAVLLMGPAFFWGQFGLYPLMKQGDVLDLLTPSVAETQRWRAKGGVLALPVLYSYRLVAGGAAALYRGLRFLAGR